MREEELASFFAVNNGYGLNLIENFALRSERFTVIPIGFGFKEKHLGSADHTPTAVFEIFFIIFYFRDTFINDISCIKGVTEVSLLSQDGECQY